MGEHGKDAKTFRVRTYVWDASDEEGPQACELLTSDWVEAANAREAAATAKLGHTPAHVDRLIVDVQRSGFSPNDKAVDWSPWRIAVVWLTGLGESEDAVRQHLERTVPLFVVERDDAGNLGVAAAAPSYLAWEAMEDLEDVLHAALGDAASEAMSSGMETRVRPDQPTAEELWRELVQSAEHGMDTASPPSASMPEIEEVEPEGPPERELICDLLLGIALEQAPDVTSLAEEHDCSEFTVEQALRSIEGWGLALPASEGYPASLLHAGEQFLTRRGRLPVETLEFLAGSPINDLNAREALRRASSLLTDELAHACASGKLAEHMRELVPAAFEAAVDAPLAARLYAAASALVVRLARGEPAGCVAEEILAVQLIELARGLLEAHEDALGQEAAAHASSEMSGMFELFQDDDVLNMFEMTDPADAAMAGHDPINQQMGVADQRVEAWFQSFGGTVPAGHLHDSRHYRWP